MKQNKIEELMQRYVDALDTQNAKSINEMLSQDFRFVMRSNKNDTHKVLSRNEFLGMIEQKKVGGVKSSIHATSTTFFGGSVLVCLSMENSKLSMNSIYTLIENKESWSIISEQININYKS